MPVVLATLVVLDLLALVATSALGVVLGDAASARLHLLAGVLTTIAFCFTHSLVLFYLIGSGKDIREAVEDQPDLFERYVPMTKRFKRRAFPWACAGGVLIIAVALSGAEVHSRLISAAVALLGDGALAEDAAIPLRQVSGWWVHLALLIVAAAVHFRAFAAEFGVVRDNRRAIGEINAELAARGVPAASRSEGA